METGNSFTTQQMAKFIFEDFFMQHFLDYYEKEYIKKESCFKDIQERFVAHFEEKSMVPKYNEEDSRINIHVLAYSKIRFQEKFLDYQIMEDGSVFFDFSVFDPLFEIKNS